MSEQLLNTKEAAEYLGISEKKLKELIRRKIIPAYKIGGAYLRFRKAQLDKVKSITTEPLKTAVYTVSEIEPSSIEKIKDFLYFNDFYIISLILIILITVVIFTS